jgi:D-ribose pyranase
MKRYGILNSHISKVLANLGHTDFIVIADAGLPIPDGVKKIDLAVKTGMPSFRFWCKNFKVSASNQL